MESHIEQITFGQVLKQLRLNSRLGLREFARLINMKPSNLSLIESGRIAPPAKKETLDTICETLSLLKGSQERCQLLDLAAPKSSKRIPADISDSIKKFEGIPVLVRTIANKKLTEKQLKELTIYIQENF